MPGDFLQQQQQVALQAMKNAGRQAWQVIEQDTDIKPLIRERPLVSLAAAAAGGLIAGYMLTPPPNRKPQHPSRSQKRNGKAKPEHKGFLGKLEEELTHAVLPVLRTFAASSAGAVFSEVHHGFSNGQAPDQHVQAEAPAPPPAVQI